MNERNIVEIWKRFRESDKKSEDGSMERAAFLSEMNAIFNPHMTWEAGVAYEIFGLVFARFDYRKNNTVEIYDFLVSMAVCTSISQQEKLLRSRR